MRPPPTGMIDDAFFLRARWPLLAVAILLLLPVPASAQYFGRNKVQYDHFDFRILETPHFDIHYYPEKAEAIEDVSRMAERWYERLARLFQHEFETSKPLILYADHPDFQQTNTLSGMIGEGTGGVTESMKNRVIMPLTGSYASTDHVLGHELVHAFQYNLAQSRAGGGIQALARLPLWMVEGMAEYLSVGPEDPLTAMWLRDALLREDLPTLRQMTRETRFFPYRFGQAFWIYVGATYGDDVAVQLFRRALRTGWEPALQQVLGVQSDTLSAQWHRAIESDYAPLMAGKTAPADAGNLILAPSTGAGRQNVSPALSPDGRHVAFISEKDLFSVDIFLADAQTGRVIRKLTSAASDPHYDALRYIDSSGAWSPDGSQFVYVVFADGRNQMVIINVENGRVAKRIAPSEVGAIANPDWSPDGRSIVFSGQKGGHSNLYLIDVETNELRQLTNDRHADFQPVFSPDGLRLVFSTDRGPETDFEQLTYSELQLAAYDLQTGRIDPIPVFGNVKHINPQFAPDGEGLYFVSDQDGFSDVYLLSLATGEVSRVTTLATAVSGISANSPAMTVAKDAGTMLFTVFDEFEFHIYAAELDGAAPERVAVTDPAPGRLIPPVRQPVQSRVSSYLADSRTGLAPVGTYDAGTSLDYTPTLELDYIGQPSIGIGSDQFGGYVAGSAAFFFSDMLGNRNLGVAVQAQGTVKDIGGQAFYQNMESRWNWGVMGGRVPYLLVQSRGGYLQDGSGTVFSQIRQRIFLTSILGMASYPFSTTRRVDFNLGATRYSYDMEEESFVFDAFGRLIHQERRDLDELVPDPLNLAQGSVALVGDNSFMGFTSPVRGTRYRLEVQQTLGTLNYQTLTADYRRYFNPITHLTFGLRGVHHGRYGSSVEDSQLQPIFVGFGSYIRGYASHTFESRECTVPPGSTGFACPEFTRLYGHRIGVANAEMRVPVLGTDQFGLINFPYVPTEFFVFGDAALAWDGQNSPTLEFNRSTSERVPVFSYGAGARFNILGFMVLEAAYANPLQRPVKGPHWTFQLFPGW